jgi:hypothetical protein
LEPQPEDDGDDHGDERARVPCHRQEAIRPLTVSGVLAVVTFVNA